MNESFGCLRHGPVAARSNPIVKVPGLICASAIPMLFVTVVSLLVRLLENAVYSSHPPEPGIDMDQLFSRSLLAAAKAA